MKNRKTWRGLLLLYHYCLFFDFKPTLSYAIIFLIKAFQNVGLGKIAEVLVNIAINQKLAKY